MIKERNFAKVLTLDEALEKSNNEPKLTKDEAREWINLKIMRKARDMLRYPDKTVPSPTIDKLATCIYEDLVSDWTYNKIILEACRAVKLNRMYIQSLVAGLFDADGKPIQVASEDSGKDKTAGESQPERAYVASMISIDEAHELKKSKSKKHVVKK